MTDLDLLALTEETWSRWSPVDPTLCEDVSRAHIINVTSDMKSALLKLCDAVRENQRGQS